MSRSKISVSSIVLILLVSIMASAFVFSVQAATYFTDGFESGTTSAWTGGRTSGGTITVESSIVHSGTYAVKLSRSGAWAYAEVYEDFGTSYTTMYFRSYVYLTSLPTSGNYLQNFAVITNKGYVNPLAVAGIVNSGGSYYWALFYCTNSLSDGTYQLESSSEAIGTNTWYCVEVMFKQGNGNGESALWVNGVQKVNVTGLTNTNYAAQEVEVGAYAQNAGSLTADSGSYTVYADDCIASNSYNGPMLPISPFSVISNSTVSQLAFNSTSQELTFTVSGPSGTHGFANVTIAKTLISDVSALKVYLNGTAINYTINDLTYYWLIHFTYHHSTHKVVLDFAPQQAKTPVSILSEMAVAIIGLVIAISGLLAIATRTRTKSPRSTNRKHTASRALNF